MFVARSAHVLRWWTGVQRELAPAVDGMAAAGPVPGSGAVDSLRAEAAALLWAMAWAVQAAGHPACAAAVFRFRFDATAIGFAAAGRWELHAGPLLQHQLFHLGALVREVARAEWQHVKRSPRLCR